MDLYTVVRLPPTPADEQSDFKDRMREQFAFMTQRFTFTPLHTYIKFRNFYDAEEAAYILAAERVETDSDPLPETSTLARDVFGDMTLPEPALLHQHGACNSSHCELCVAEQRCDYCWREGCDGYDCRRCDNCGSLSCQGRCEDERAYEDEDDDHGPHCRCCGEADEEVGTRYAGYCGYTCANDDY